MAKKTKKHKLSPTLASAMDEVTKQFGAGAVILAAEGEALDIPRIRTGIFSIDYVSGGGIPRGKIIILDGEASGGKSSTALQIVVSFQSHCRNCGDPIYETTEAGKYRCSCKKAPEPMRVLWYDAEGIWANTWADEHGVDLELIHVIRTEAAEDGLDICRHLLGTGEFDLFVLDSIAHLTPTKELEDSMGKVQPGGQARLVNRALREFVAKQTKDGGKGAPTIVLINQIRYKIGVMFGDPRTRPGGVGMDFASSLDLRFKKAKKFYLDVECNPVAPTKAKDSGYPPAYVEVSFNCTKNRVFAAGLNGGYQLYVSNGPVNPKTGQPAWSKGTISDFDWVWSMAQKENLVERDGKNWRCGKLTASSKPDLKTALQGSAEDQESLKDALLSILL